MKADSIAEALATQTKVTSLAFDSDRGGLNSRHWKQIFASPGGRALDAFAHSSFSDEDLAAITVDKPCGLRSLNLCRSRVSAEGIVRFLKSPAGGKIERVVTWSSDAQPRALEKLLRTLPANHPLVYVGIGHLELAKRFIDANVTDHPEAVRRGWH